MEIEKQVCFIEQAKHLKKLGIKQDSFFYYVYERKKIGGDVVNGYVYETTSDFYLAVAKDTCLYEMRRSQTSAYGFGCECCNTVFDIDDKEIYSAFTVAELGEIISNHCQQWKQKPALMIIPNEGKTEAIRRAEILIEILTMGE